MFCEKYKPDNLEKFIGNSNAVIQINNWLVDWQNSNPKTKACILSGKTGIGKSLLAELLANKYGYFICNIENHINSLEKIFNLTKTIFNIFRKKNILIIDDIDCADTAFINSIIQCVKETLIPIIITCNDFYEKKIRTLVGLCFSV
ncbi:MAG: AAA family ATPase, partial [Chitinophagia bacterium]|nr:AAA family ATPase [Chitinophagia bacterium]